MNYDLIILGAGPAGLTAAIYALRYNLKTLVIGNVPGGLMTESHKICNWPGELEIAGWELSQKMKNQAEKLGAEFSFETVVSAEIVENNWLVKTDGGKDYSAPCVIYSLGTEHRKLDLPATEKYKGKGISYCATCDAMFYKGKTTAVVGGGNSAMTAALYLAEICPKVYIISRGPELKGEVSWMNELKARTNIVHIASTNITDLKGEEKLASIVLDKLFEEQNELAVEGLFIEIGLTPKTELFKAWGGELDEFGKIKVGTDMSTNLPGMFAAGDITNGSNGFRQIVTAVSEGAIAADSAFNGLQKKKQIKI